jgi:hypothetical protein
MAPTLTWLQSSGIYLGRQVETLAYAAPVEAHRSVDPCQTIHNCPSTSHGCGDPWWDMSLRELSLTEDILSISMYRYSYSPQIKCFRTNVDFDIFLALECGTRARNFSALSIIPCLAVYMKINGIMTHEIKLRGDWIRVTLAIIKSRNFCLLICCLKT